MSDDIIPKIIESLDEAGWNELTQLGAPVADPTANTAVGVAPIQTWSTDKAVLPDIGNVDNKLLAAAGLSNTILVSTETRELLAAITVSVGANGNWYVGQADTGIQAQGTDPAKILRPPGVYALSAQSWVEGTRELTISAGTAYCVFPTGSTDVHQVVTTTSNTLTVKADTQAVCLDHLGNIVELDDSTNPLIGTALAPLAYWDESTGTYRKAETVPELLYNLISFNTQQVDLIATITQLVADALAHATQAGVSAGEAAASAQAAALSAQAAASSASGAATSKGEAAASAAAANTSAGLSATQAQASADSATASASSATASALSASESKGSETQAATSASAANTSKLAAESAKDDAVTAETQAGTSATASATSAGESAASATAAAGSATAASGSATAAHNSATAAAGSESTVAGHAVAAKASEDAAKLSETAAASSATAASNSATAAEGFKDDAELARTGAEDAQGVAATKASEASTSATTAATKAGEAAGSATNAGTMAAAAASSANEADTSKTQAASSASSASTSAATATTKATEATNAKTAAATSASNAATAKTQAETAKTAAVTAKTQAETAAAEAAGSESASAASESAAHTSATNAAGSAATAAADATRAETAAASLTGAMIEAGSVNLSNNTAPPPLQDTNGNDRACFWKVTGAGTVNGIDYGVGDSIVYSAELDQYYKIDNTESVTSVDGLKGVVSLAARYVSMTAAQTIAGVKTFSAKALFSLGIDLGSTLTMKKGSGAYSNVIQLISLNSFITELRGADKILEFVNRTTPAVAATINLEAPYQPLANSHLTRKDYVDTQVSTKWTYNATTIDDRVKALSYTKTQSDSNYLGASAKATSAAIADKVTIAALSTNANYKMLFGTSDGNVYYDAGLVFNPSTNNLLATGNITGFSDRRLKDEIEHIPDALSKVLSLGGYTYVRIDKGMEGIRQTGLIAQELEEVLPEAVTTSEDGIKAVAYGNTVGLLVEAIKELNAKVEKLEGK